MKPLKIPYLLDVDALGKQDILTLLDSAAVFFAATQERKSVPPLLSGKTVATIFFERSTRTRLSFARAARILGGEILDLPIDLASIRKGESLRSTLRTVQNMGADVVVMRHPDSGSPYFAAKNLSVPVVNAGDGGHAHPTQALIDLFTIRHRLKRLEGLKIAIVGDILFSRVASSDITILRKFNAKIKVFGPQPLLPKGWRLGKTVSDGTVFSDIHVASSINEAISDTDAVIILRMQKERHSSIALPESAYTSLCHLDKQLLEDFARPDTVVMHAGPMNEGVEISPSLARSSKCTVEEQVKYGVAIRMAVLSAVCSEKE